MNLFWQITLIELLLNVAVFAGAIIFYGPVNMLAQRFSGGRNSIEKTASGVLFGLATAAALMLPIHLEGGAAVGCATILLALAGPLDGYVAILGGVVSSVAIELVPWLMKYQTSQTLIVELLVSAAVSLIFLCALRYFPGHRNAQLQYFHLPLLGMLSAAGGLCVLGFSQGTASVLSSILPAAASNICATVVLGTLLLHEKRRSATEVELRVGEAILAAQAKELALARDTADRANRAKSTFLANMSHELRTPLNAILGYTQLLKRSPQTTKWQSDAYHTIHQSGEHLLMLIVDLLDLSKIEAEKLELQLSTVHMPAFLQGIASIIRIKATEKALEFECEFSPNLPSYIQADQKHLRQVLLNLLSNAIKFTDRGRVTFEVTVLFQSREDVQLRFGVRDTGSGIPQDHLETIFRPFEQLGDEQSRSGGTGLGLSISRKLVRLMGGEIQVKSTPGQGSIFSFEVGALVAEYEGSASLVGGQVQGYDGPRKRVLVVDDIDANRFVLADTLGQLGFDIEQAANGLEALKAAQSTPTDLVLMDVRMPVMDGLEAMRQMRQNPELCRVPIIAVSAGVTKNEQEECLAAGAKAILTKPIDEASMLKQIGSLLDLTWIIDTPQQTLPAMNYPGEHFVLPEPEQMKSLRDLAKTGNMRAISEKAESLATSDARYRPFADKITELARGYQSRALLHMMEKHVARQQEGEAQ
jgi:signal transduction histidine kinase/ActR/RegA family two-component response regulator